MNKNIAEQSGRSMIEMLGVLAIVGVLSVAAIAGYNKAMSKYKINKLVDQVNIINNNLKTFYAGESEYKGINSIEDAINLGIIPEEMIDKDTNEVRHALGGTIGITTSEGRAHVVINGLDREWAIAIATQDWGAKNISINNK